MPLYISEEEVEQLVTVEEAITAVDDLFHLMGTGHAPVAVRQRPKIDHSMIQIMGGAVEGVGLGLKAYTVTGSGPRFVVLLFDHDTGELLALVEADRLGRCRTAAASGVGTRYMAKADAKSLGVIGSGWQAIPQIEAVCAVRGIDEVRIYSPNEEHRAAAAHEASERVRAAVTAVGSAEEAVSGADVVVTITSALNPVVRGAWLSPGCHVNAAGSNRITCAELDGELMRMASIVAVDNLEQAKSEAGDIARAVSEGSLKWEKVVELGSIVAASRGNGLWDRPEGAITVFESLGVGTEDVALARVVYEKARRSGAGRRFPS
ncbi:MAG TPA: ornithine cyclodeaminase family protein [Spirochaetia bacterium]|nr:ornithine cyclodeaminase family protein [Spirochaetia bacterium]